MTRTVEQTLGNPDAPDGKQIGAKCVECGHESLTVEANHMVGGFECEECAGPVEQTLIDNE